MNKQGVLVAFDSMRNPNTGLFHFGKSFGRALLKNNRDRFDLNFLLHPSTSEFDRDDVKKRYLKKYHKLFYINTDRFKLFHFTDQLPRLSPAMVTGKKILTIHDMNQVHETLTANAVQKYLSKLRKHIDSCDRIIAISNFVAADVLAHFPDAVNKLSVIYNGADKLEVKPDHQPAYIPKRKFLFTIGMLSLKKNFAVLPALLVGNNYELIISGIKSDYEAVIMEQAQKYKCADRVKITGPVSDAGKAWYYQHCEAFVFPSLAEGFGLPVIEAMHFGKPVFCSNRTSLPEIAGDAAFYFDDFDGVAMREVFKTGMETFRSNNGSEKVIAHASRYNWSSTAQQYLNLYQEVLKHNSFEFGL